VINLLKQTLVGTGALLVSAVFLFAFSAPAEDYFHSMFNSRGDSLASLSSHSKINLR
jgi:hypothetical protein